MFEATKDVLRSHISNKDRQYNGKEKTRVRIDDIVIWRKDYMISKYAKICKQILVPGFSEIRVAQSVVFCIVFWELQI